MMRAERDVPRGTERPRRPGRGRLAAALDASAGFVVEVTPPSGHVGVTPVPLRLDNLVVADPLQPRLELGQVEIDVGDTARPDGEVGLQPAVILPMAATADQSVCSVESGTAGLQLRLERGAAL